MVRVHRVRLGSTLRTAFLAVAIYTITVPSQCLAQPFTYTGNSGGLSAAATFEQVGTNLIVTLANTSANDVLQQSQVLTAVFFTLAGDPSLSRISAKLGSGSVVLFGSTDPGKVVGGEWAYVNHLSGAPLGADEGISSSGLGLFGLKDLFPGTNLQGPSSPDGVQYGITSAGDNPATGQSAVTGGNALIRDSVVFTLAFNANYVLTAGSISKVNFQYGTALTPTEPNIPAVVPEPPTVVFAGIGLLLLVCFRRAGAARRGKSSRAPASQTAAD
jgi:hypothetical protein